MERAFWLAYGHPPGAEEQAQSLQFLESQRALLDSPADATLVDLCHALLNSNEFLYVD